MKGEETKLCQKCLLGLVFLNIVYRYLLSGLSGIFQFIIWLHICIVLFFSYEAYWNILCWLANLDNGYTNCLCTGGKPRDLRYPRCYCEKPNGKQTSWLPDEPACCGWLRLSKPEDVSSPTTQSWPRCLSGCCGEGYIFHHGWFVVWHLCWDKSRYMTMYPIVTYAIIIWWCERVKALNLIESVW